MNFWDVLWLLEESFKAKWRRVRHTRKSRILNWISTGDLDSNGKLYPDYKERRERKRKKRNEPKAFDSIDIDF